MSPTTTQNRIDKRRRTREGERRSRRSQATTTAPRRRGTDRSMETLFEGALGSTTGRDRERRLEEVVLTTWAALAAGHPVECPVCGGALTATKGCKSCGSSLG